MCAWLMVVIAATGVASAAAYYCHQHLQFHSRKPPRARVGIEVACKMDSLCYEKEDGVFWLPTPNPQELKGFGRWILFAIRKKMGVCWLPTSNLQELKGFGRSRYY